jgi:hypothetical protein
MAINFVHGSFSYSLEFERCMFKHVESIYNMLAISILIYFKRLYSTATCNKDTAP